MGPVQPATAPNGWTTASSTHWYAHQCKPASTACHASNFWGSAAASVEPPARWRPGRPSASSNGPCQWWPCRRCSQCRRNVQLDSWLNAARSSLSSAVSNTTAAFTATWSDVSHSPADHDPTRTTGDINCKWHAAIPLC